MQKLSSLCVVIRKITNIISFIEITIQLTKKINDILLWFIVLTVWVLNILMAVLTDDTGNKLKANNLI